MARMNASVLASLKRWRAGRARQPATSSRLTACPGASGRKRISPSTYRTDNREPGANCACSRTALGMTSWPLLESVTVSMRVCTRGVVVRTVRRCVVVDKLPWQAGMRGRHDRLLARAFTSAAPPRRPGRGAWSDGRPCGPTPLRCSRRGRAAELAALTCGSLRSDNGGESVNEAR